MKVFGQMTTFHSSAHPAALRVTMLGVRTYRQSFNPLRQVGPRALNIWMEL